MNYEVINLILKDSRADVLQVDEVNGRKITSAVAETNAKATNFYKEYKKASLYRELMYEVVQVCKKLAGSIDKEITAQIK